MSESTYSVYLVQRHGEQGGKREVTSPVSGHELDFYETGVWLDHDTGRNFFPYGQIRTIREHPEDDPTDSEAATSEKSGESDELAVSDEGPSEGGNAGAEEDMLEE
ncbi:hypothetical protein [Halorussus litoreus]|uniref:hypothetical protein n=1 Tax=Halorussus litoreus TaxID=1710536 RepID=UPI0018E4E4CE|nr:hypothetical protein [Halorussus litoreus]